MAKTISDEQMKLSIIINGNSAKKNFWFRENTLTSANSDLLFERKTNWKQLGKESTEYKANCFHKS
jgi:tubulin-specific chaperone A